MFARILCVVRGGVNPCRTTTSSGELTQTWIAVNRKLYYVTDYPPLHTLPHKIRDNIKKEKQNRY